MAADSGKPLALINHCQRVQVEGWDEDGSGIGLVLRMEGGVWCFMLQHLERIFLLGKCVAGQEVGVSSASSRHSVFNMSFIQVDKDSDFPLQNLPYGVFSTKEEVSSSKTLSLGCCDCSE